MYECWLGYMRIALDISKFMRRCSLQLAAVVWLDLSVCSGFGWGFGVQGLWFEFFLNMCVRMRRDYFSCRRLGEYTLLSPSSGLIPISGGIVLCEGFSLRTSPRGISWKIHFQRRSHRAGACGRKPWLRATVCLP